MDVLHFYLHFVRIYDTLWAVLPAPRQAVPPTFSGVIVFFCPHSSVRGGDSVVTWEGIFQFCMVITAVIALVLQANNNKKR